MAYYISHTLLFFRKENTLPNKKKRYTIPQLNAYIQSVFQENYNKTVSTRQVETFRKQDGLSNDDIANAVKYWFEIKGNPTDRQYTKGGIGIVPYIIDESRAYWREQERLATIAQENEKRDSAPLNEVDTVEAKITPIKKPLGIYYFDIN